MMSKNELAQQIEFKCGVKPRLAKTVLDALAEIAAEEIEKGNDFTVPGIAKLSFRYSPASKKGERWKKGEERTKFGGEVEIAEADSPATKAKIALKAAPTGKVAKLKPGTKPEAQAVFLKSKAGRAVAARKRR
jgi:nucleoid DNA-binding protein